jgi:hypothetical protein
MSTAPDRRSVLLAGMRVWHQATLRALSAAPVMNPFQTNGVHAMNNSVGAFDDSLGNRCGPEDYPLAIAILDEYPYLGSRLTKCQIVIIAKVIREAAESLRREEIDRLISTVLALPAQIFNGLSPVRAQQRALAAPVSKAKPTRPSGNVVAAARRRRGR